MRIRTAAKTSLPWDYDSNASDTESNNDEDSSSVSSRNTTDSHNNRTPTTIHNPYNPPTPSDPIQPSATLRAWITTQPRQRLTGATTAPLIPATLNNSRQQQYHRPQLTTPTANEHWGDTMTQPKPSNIFRILSKNVNTMTNSIDYVHWKAAAHALEHSSADAAFLQETNLAWDKVHRR